MDLDDLSRSLGFTADAVRDISTKLSLDLQFSYVKVIRNALVDKDFGLRPWATRIEDFVLNYSEPSISADADVLALIENYTNDEEFEVMYPFRTKKDKSIRRTRFLDVLELYKSLGIKRELILYLTVLRGFDYISCVNILRASAFFYDKKWFNVLFHLGAFLNLKIFVETTKEFSVKIKNSGQVLEYSHFVEAYNLSGYRNPPFEDFNLFNEASNLANSGKDEHEIGSFKFNDFVNSCFPLIVSDISYLSFHDFVYSGEWTTSGASSDGKAIFKSESGELFKVKARKNLAIDILDLDELIANCFDLERQDNVAIVKSELGKLRIAVAGDLKPYLMMSYLNRYLNKCYLSWPNNTMEEDNIQTLSRMEKMVNLTSMGAQLPFDFSNFDHQPTKKELQMLIAHLCKQAKLNAPVRDNDCIRIADLVESTFSNSYLNVKLDDGMVSLPVKGGLMSGMRWTSLIGNMWNTVISTMVEEIVKTVTGNSLLARFIRGDDSALFCRDFTSAYLFKKTYDLMRVKSVAGKFAIMEGYMEFLRIQYTPTGCFAYPLRSIPNYLQSKPWTAAPWNPFNSFDTLKDVGDTLKRRGVNEKTVDLQLNITFKIMCDKIGVPYNILTIPKELGGIGVLPWTDHIYYPNLLKLATITTDLKLSNSNGWRRVRLTDVCKKFDLTPDPERLVKQVDSEIASILMGDEVPDVKKRMRQEFNRRISGFDFTEHRLEKKIVYPNLEGLNLATVTSLHTVTDVIAFMNINSASAFGRYPKLSNIWKELAVVARLCDVKTLDLLRKQYPDMYDLVKAPRYKHLHRSSVIDFLSGKLPSSVIDVNPSSSFLIEKFTGSYIDSLMSTNHITLDRDSFLAISSSVKSSVSDALKTSPLYKLYYML